MGIVFKEVTECNQKKRSACSKLGKSLKNFKLNFLTFFECSKMPATVKNKW